jgi:Holliday junction resolvase RusA-like endonuclease
MEETDEMEGFDFPGEVLVSVDVEPVSLQSTREKKDIITTAIREEIKAYDFIYTGDVQVEIEWLVHQRKRYETHLAPDVDNIIKPILDALCGPVGILINDCQVQFVSSHWIDWTRSDEKVNVRVRPLLADEHMNFNLICVFLL